MKVNTPGANAPIALFTYNRPIHTRKVLDALSKCYMADESELIIFSDHWRSKSDIPSVVEVRNVISEIDGFKNVKLILRNENFGLKRNILQGVSDVLSRYDKVIVLEDDLIVDEEFLVYMNSALSIYENSTEIWHIGAWAYPISVDIESDAYFLRIMNCWGWATWANRWVNYEEKPEHIIKSWSWFKRRRFNLDGVEPYWRQIVLNNKGVINTWAIFWYTTIFENKGLCLYPKHSLVTNSGFDGSGEHCASFSPINQRKIQYISKKKFEFPVEIKESRVALNAIKYYLTTLKGSLLVRINRRLAEIKSKY